MRIRVNMTMKEYREWLPGPVEFLGHLVSLGFLVYILCRLDQHILNLIEALK